MADLPEPDEHSVLTKAVMTLLFASDKPLSQEAIQHIFDAAHANGDFDTQPSSEDLENVLSKLQADILPQLGLMLGRASGGYRILTAIELAPLVGHLFPTRKTRFSPAALETIALIAYRQPCTRAEIESVRGVDCGGVLRNLLERGLIRIVGQRDEPGRPLIYATSDEFLSTFSLDSLNELPPLRQIEKLSDETNFRAELLTAAAEEDPKEKQLSFDTVATEPSPSAPECSGSDSES